MVEKTKTNEHGDVIFTEDDAIDLLYTNPDFDISKLFFEDTAKYDAALKELGLDLPTIRNTPERGSLQEFDKRTVNNGTCQNHITRSTCYNGCWRDARRTKRG
jgi:hypothetical protein